MSIETYELLVGKLELYNLIEQGIDQIKNGNNKTVNIIRFLSGRRNWKNLLIDNLEL